MLIKEMGLCKENHFILKNLNELKGFRANKLIKEFAKKKDRIRPL